jgi:hypothetical protein
MVCTCSQIRTVAITISPIFSYADCDCDCRRRDIHLWRFYRSCKAGQAAIYMCFQQDFSTTLLQTSEEVPTPRAAHGAALIGTTLLICGGKTNFGDQNVLNYDSLYLLNLGTSDLLMCSPTPADHSFALQYRESGPALWSMVLGRVVATTMSQPWSVPSSSSSVVRLAGRPMICGHSI